ncbi:TCAM1 protein, partial [Eudromia elegans]|nr:TCAM1 protein [Eudromia elegans]
MSPRAALQPSFEDVFDILSQVPEEKLLKLRRKLEHSAPTRHGTLLRAMVLLTLRQEADAGTCLNALQDERAALYVRRSRLGPGGAREAPRDLDASALVLLARIYSLLADEQLCGREAVARAYERGVEACGASGDPRREPLQNCPDKAREKCSAAVGLGSRFQMLRSDLGMPHTASTSAAARSSPVPISSASGPWGPRTLRSSGSPASFVSRFEISASPTALFHSQALHGDRGSPVQPTGCHGDTRDTGSTGDTSDIGNTGSTGDTRDIGSAGDTGSIGAPPAGSCHLPLPVPGTPSPDASKSPAERRNAPGTSAAEPGAPTGPQQEDPPASVPNSRAASPSPPTMSSHTTCPPAAASLPPQPPASSAAAPGVTYPSPLHSPFPPTCPTASAPEPGGEQSKFFTFVVLHAASDADTALRVRRLLEGLGVPDGATFCEDFLAGGRGQLSCFQDAMENSAFTILLLTRNFLCQLCLFQTNSALMESILRPSKHNSVIPFVPKENPLGESEIPIFLRGLVPLNETSPVFAARVRNTFTRSKVGEQKALWQHRRQVQEQQRRLRLYQEHCQALSHLSALSLGSLPQAPWPL